MVGAAFAYRIVKRMPSHDTPREPVTEADVLAHLSRSRKPQSLREIAAALKLSHRGRRALSKVVVRLKRRGDIVQFPNARIALPKGKAAEKIVAREQTRVQQSGGKPRGESHAAKAIVSVHGDLAPIHRGGAPHDAGEFTGRLVAHRDGYGFVVPDEPRPDLEGDLFIPASAIGDAMHGDRVLARIQQRHAPIHRGGGGRQFSGPQRTSGRILRVLSRAHVTVVGLFRYASQGNTVAPYESRLTQEIIIPPGDELTPELRAKHGPHPPKRGARLPELDGAVVNVELTRFPSGGVAAAGRVIEILGRPGDFGVDVEILIRKHHLPHEFADDVMADALAAAHPVDEVELVGRRDFRSLPIVTIDGETARDFDDAVHVARLANGRWELQVHIADVSHYVRRGAALDREARLRGTSVYFPNRAVPMLPEELSNGICSLNPREDRLVMSAVMEIDAGGEIVAAEFARGVIRSAERMTYTAVNAVLEGNAEATARYAPLAENFRAMRDLALVLNARRSRLGSIDFDLPEPVIEFDTEGRMTGIVRSERNIAHRLIEEFMLAANQAVAHYLERRGIASLHRVHEKPDAKKILEFEELAHTFGYTLGVENLSERLLPVRHGTVRTPHTAQAQRGHGGGRDRPMSVSVPGALDLAILPQHYQRLAEKIAGKPEERILSYLMLRSLKQARYSPEPLGHFALAFAEYTHFTSPIRRYPDLIVHRVLKWALAHPEQMRRDHHSESQSSGTQSAPPHEARTKHDKYAASLGPYPLAELEAVAVESSETERRAETAERELMDWKTAQFMEQHLGEEYDALVISVQKFGFFVELMEIFVEGLVPVNRLEELTGERCFYRERDHALVCGRPAGSRSGRPARGHQGSAVSRSLGTSSHGRHASSQSIGASPRPVGTPGELAWKLGDRVRVRAERIDPIRRRVEFAVI